MTLRLWLSVVGVGLVLLSVRLVALRLRGRPDPVIDDLIQKAAAKPKHEGFDPALRERANEKRRHQDSVQSRANRIAATPVDKMAKVTAIALVGRKAVDR